MALNYYLSYLKSAPSSPQDKYKTELQQMIDQQFSNASDVYTISEEQTLGNLDWQDITVRITHVSVSETGTKLGNDWRGLIFSDMTHSYKLGQRYQFDNNYWTTVFTDTYKFPTASATIRRDNQVLRWYSNNILLQEPCIIDYDLRLTRFYFGSEIIIPQGQLRIVTQYNNNTKNIGINQRFLFGGQAWKVDAVNNFLNDKTFDQTTPSLIYISLFKDIVNTDKDDVANNIVDGLVQFIPSPTPTSGNVISPSDVTSILQNNTQTYTVQHLVNNVADTNTFAITVSGASSNFYILNIIDGNHFSITSLGYISTPLIVSCKNNIDGTTVSVNISLRGLF